MATRAAILALHYQNDVLHADGKVALGLRHDPAQRASLEAAARTLMAAGRAAGVPVISVGIELAADPGRTLQNAPIFRAAVTNGAMTSGSWGADFYETLRPEPGEPVVMHGRVNAFFNSDLESVVTSLGVTDLYIGGVATNSTVEHTARHAADMGYRVTVVSDACACAIPHLHRASLENLAFVAEIASVADVTAAWQRRP